MTNEDLRAAIETALRRRDPEAEVIVSPLSTPTGVYWTALAQVRDGRVEGTCVTERGALEAFAIGAGLRDDGSDPAADVERLTVEIATLKRQLRTMPPWRVSEPPTPDEMSRVWRAATGDTHDGPESMEALLAAVEGLRRERDDAREALRASLRCDECEALATRTHADTASFGCDSHGVGDGWSDTTHAAAVRAAMEGGR